MVKDAPGELHVAAIQAMLEVGGDHPHPFAALYQGHLTWLKAFLSHTDATGSPPLPSPLPRPYPHHAPTP